MADPNNVPQEVQQLKEDINSSDEETSQKAKADVASTDFDKEYEIAQENETGSGTQSSDSNPINREGANTGEKVVSKGTVDNIDSPGDSDPDDYMNMAKDIGKNVDAGE
ncbi:MAG: hypothetical protein WA783_03205 [Phormidesmis sp.]